MQIDCPDDLFEFIFELSSKIEDFNKDTLRKILEYAEKRAIVPQDHTDLANWYKKFLNIDKSQKNNSETLV